MEISRITYVRLIIKWNIMWWKIYSSQISFLNFSLLERLDISRNLIPVDEFTVFDTVMAPLIYLRFLSFDINKKISFGRRCEKVSNLKSLKLSGVCNTSRTFIITGDFFIYLPFLNIWFNWLLKSGQTFIIISINLFIAPWQVFTEELLQNWRIWNMLTYLITDISDFADYVIYPMTYISPA